MPFNRPTLIDLTAQAESDVASRLGLGALLRRSVLAAIARTSAGLAHLLHGHLVWISRQIFAETADDEELERIGTEFGVFRKAASRAVGIVRFNGTDGVLIPAGTKVRRADGWEYATDVDGTIASTFATIAVTSTTAGAAGDAPAYTALTLVAAIAGVQSAAVVNPGGDITGGADLESDDDLRARIRQRRRQSPRGGGPGDYERWALEVPNVERAWALRQHTGPGTVGVTFLTDGGAVPSAGKVTEVQTYIDARRPLTANVTVFAPATQAIAITMTLTPNTAAVRAAVTAALADFFNRVAGPGTTIYRSQLSEAISGAAGETNHVLTVPASDTTVPAGTIATLGTVTFS